ncbi:hypothetical protein SLUN_04895 [Streptomyces lunaelactis]|uniref:Uncharacterized protein n=1 Tax=Streptomyces lunaelactis TaxID=1535768 RepID=A0A2R4SXL9_9ACTN|nr:hypothetical protein SLUN_04895 [Streptomyces lunaelactis]
MRCPRRPPVGRSPHVRRARSRSADETQPGAEQASLAEASSAVAVARRNPARSMQGGLRASRYERLSSATRPTHRSPVRSSDAFRRPPFRCSQRHGARCPQCTAVRNPLATGPSRLPASPAMFSRHTLAARSRVSRARRLHKPRSGPCAQPRPTTGHARQAPRAVVPSGGGSGSGPRRDPT